MVDELQIDRCMPGCGGRDRLGTRLAENGRLAEKRDSSGCCHLWASAGGPERTVSQVGRRCDACASGPVNCLLLTARFLRSLAACVPDRANLVGPEAVTAPRWDRLVFQCRQTLPVSPLLLSAGCRRLLLVPLASQPASQPARPPPLRSTALRGARDG